jgi:hypothetical protein
MIPEVEQSGWIVATYWLLMFPIAVAVLVRTTAFWADDGPGTVFEAVRATLLTGLVVFLTYDLSGYVFARLMQSPQLGIVFPAGYGYWHWIREPLCLKWQVLGFVPFIRYLPVLFALTAGGTLQVLWWRIPFRQGVLAFISQIILNVLAMAMLSLVFVFFIGMREGAPASSSASPEGLPGLQQRVRELGARKGPFAGGIRERWESINRVFEPGYAFFQPITRYLPLPVQDFLHAGGWLIAGLGLAALGWYGWRNRYRSSRRRPNAARPQPE